MTRKEAIEKIRKWDFLNDEEKEAIEVVCPELKESEDEKIVKHLITLFTEEYGRNSSARFAGIKVKDILAWLEKQGEQKPADKVKPKFKVGDWIVYNRNDHSREIVQIYDIRDDRYYFNDNVHFSWSIKECDEKSHLWTIQDTKDGDILASNRSDIIIVRRVYRHQPFAYCGVNNNEFMLSDSKEFWHEANYQPATKEQRDLLFQKMYEAGYEWDAENKKLKKEEEVDNLHNYLYGEPNSAWSEDDKNRFSNLIWLVNQSNENRATKEGFIKFINRLKSLKPQPQWKPSKEQLNALDEVYKTHSANNVCRRIIFNLLEQLKKL